MGTTKDPSNFCHLHVHSEFSTLDGINRIGTDEKSMAVHAKNMGMVALALTDHGNMAGAYKHFKACKQVGIKPIIGIEAYYTVNDKGAREKDEDGQNYYHVVLNAMNNTGLKNLIKMSTKAYSDGMYYKPRADTALLQECSEGVMATSACLGSRTSKLIAWGRQDEAERLILHHSEIFKDRFFIELQLHDGLQQQVNQGLMAIAKKHGLPMILTADCHYTGEDHKEMHEQTLCMSTNAIMADPPWDPERTASEDGKKKKTRFSFGDIDVHMAHHDWMWEEAQKYGIPYEAIKNTRYFADLVQDDYFSDRKNRYPKCPTIPEGITAWDELEHRSKVGLESRFGGNRPPDEYIERLYSELLVIKKMGFYHYITIVQDYIDNAKEKRNALVGPGRGSGAGSLICWALKITEIDPIRYGLIFSRWLNYGRAATPMVLDEVTKLKIKRHMCSSETHEHCDHDH